MTASSGYTGSYVHSVDPKGRVVVPATAREHFGAGSHLWVRRDHIAMYDATGWAGFMQKLRELKDTRAMSRDQFNQVLARVYPVSPDSQGRFVLPTLARTELDVRSEVMFVGTDDCFSIYPIEKAPNVEGESVDDLFDLIDTLPL